MKSNLLILSLFITTITCYAQAPAIVLNQCGFNPAGTKIAVVTYSPASEDFYILTADKKDTVYRAMLQAPIQSVYSSTINRIADFSNFKKTGSFVVCVKGIPPSPAFAIQKNVFNTVSTASLKAFYYQRSDITLEEKYAGKWKRPAGHPDTNVLIHPSAASAKKAAGYMFASPGGWYDAGDYNKYIVNSGITMGTLMSAYEDFPDYYQALSINIPETGNGVPDILNEVLYNLRWMLTMQDKDDGGVYHKCTNASFDGKVMPGVTKAPRYVVQKSTAAALDFAAVMAQAARVYKKFESKFPGLTDSCIKAAESAWQWSVNNAAVVYNQEEMNKHFAPVISTGAYGDKSLSDEWFWAAVELSATTGNTSYLSNSHVPSNANISIPTWNKVDMLGVYTALKYTSVFTGSKLNTTKLRSDMLAFANTLTSGGNAAFKTAMGQSPRDFVWGSNAVAMNQSMFLLKAYLLAGNKTYFEAALSNLDYVLGRNATGYCFVTGIGNKSPLHIHHRPSEADGIDEPVPGLLAGGANPGKQDKCYYPFTAVETSYTDEECSYASNEIAINWNAPLVYVAGGINVLQ
ncbi:cellulase [Terrimonas sp.]|uniref:glycoside hydrolase family 9 protein n=1 Tax=Terrimonas sp. TaxID=1914338 RepID=UPI000D50C3DE|nr:glycoside hydrolase family 9 protein [Terrimonas sp.]PVD53705.1 cellulase [Terrimonas sp.]